MKNVKKIMAKHKSEILPDKKIKDNVRRELGFDGAQYRIYRRPRQNRWGFRADIFSGG